MYSYVPASSVYDVFAGIYIMHEPVGLAAKQVSAVPAGVVLDGQLVAMVICRSVIAT